MKLSKEEITEIAKLFLKLYTPEEFIKILIKEWDTDDLTKRAKFGELIQWFWQTY